MKILVCPKCKSPYMDTDRCCPNCGETFAPELQSNNEVDANCKISPLLCWSIFCALAFHLFSIVFEAYVMDADYDLLLNDSLGFILFDCIMMFFTCSIALNKFNLSKLYVIVISVLLGYSLSIFSIVWANNSTEDSILFFLRCALWIFTYTIVLFYNTKRIESRIGIYFTWGAIITDIILWYESDFHQVLF